MARIVQNGISYSGSPTSSYFDITGILQVGETEITLQHSGITANSNIDVYTDHFGVNPKSIAISQGSATIQFSSQLFTVGVKLRIWKTGFYINGKFISFTETPIGTGTSAGVLTFTDSYENYQFLIFRSTNTSTGYQNDFLITPEGVHSCFDIGGHGIVFNQAQTNQYGTYEYTDATTWTRAGYRNVYISEVIGVNCVNYQVDKTEIYNKGAYDTTSRTVTSTDLLSYDMFIIFVSNDGIEAPALLTMRPIFFSDGCESYNLVTTPYNTVKVVDVTDTSMSSAQYHYVQGIKFEMR